MAATAAGTRAYFEKHRIPTAPHILGPTQWSVSPVGFGCYRIDEHSPAHHDALKKALLSGCNLIDTSTNYTNGSSERLVGKVVRELLDSKAVAREEIVVVTKIGYLQGDNLELAQERDRQANPFPEVVRYQDGCWHCISPEFLDDQITRSLSRLKLDRIDVLLLHNPEYFLKRESNHAEYYRRIRAAFEHLEKEVERGRIQYYGISSNTFPDPRESDEYTSLETTLELARSLRVDHHYAVVQFPMNLYEPGAALEPNNSGKTLLELADSENLGVLINRPLNAFGANRLIRLADFPAHAGEDLTEKLRQTLARTMELETQYVKADGEQIVAMNRIAWGHILKQNFDQLSEIEQWKQVLNYQIRPILAEALRELTSTEEFCDWARDYDQASEKLFSAFTAYLEAQNARESHRISAALDQKVPSLRNTPTLSRKALQVYRSMPGVSSVLVGMREPSYVADVMHLDPAIPAEEAKRAFDAVVF